MSTKIFNGWIHLADSVVDPFDVAGQLRLHVTPAVNSAYRRAIAGRAVAMIDDAACDQSPIMDAELEMANAARAIKASGLRNPAKDFSCEVALLRDPDQRHCLLALTYTELELADAFNSAGLYEYRYFNSTDRPAELSETEWDERRDTWERALGTDTPAERGLVWSCAEPFGHALVARGDERTEMFAGMIPTRTERARRLLRNEAAAAATVGYQHSGSTAELVRLVTDAHAQVTDEEIAARAEQLGELTVADLYTRP